MAEELLPPRKKLKRDGFISFLSGDSILGRMAERSFVGALWNAPIVKSFIKESCKKSNNTFYFCLEKDREEVVQIVLQILEGISMPELFKENLSRLIRPMGLHLFEFLSGLNVGHSTIDIFLGEPTLIHWKADGTIDKRQSLDQFIQHETARDPQQRLTSNSDLYVIACNYCLEEHVSSLCLSLSSDEQKKFEDSYEEYDNHLIAYWTATVKGNMHGFLERITESDSNNLYNSELSVNQNMVSLCIRSRNLFALRYFWWRLKIEEMELNLKKWLTLVINHTQWRHFKLYGVNFHVDEQNDPYALITSFLFTHLNDAEQQRNAFRSTLPRDQFWILRSFFQMWPLQRYFLPTMSAMTEYITEAVYENVMLLVSVRIGKDIEAVEMLRKIWSTSSPRLQRSFSLSLCHMKWPDPIINLFLISEFETAYILLSEATDSDKKRMTDNLLGYAKYILEEQVKFHDFIQSSSNWQSIDELLFETLPSNTDKLSFKLNLLVAYFESKGKGFKVDPQAGFSSWTLNSLNDIPDSNQVIFDPVKTYTALIFLDYYGAVDKFLNWAFKTDLDKLKLKQSLCHQNHIKKVEFLLSAFSEMGDEGWNRCEKFINYNFCWPEAVSEFKIAYLHTLEILIGSGRLLRVEFDFFDSLLNWWYNSSSEITLFKNELLLYLAMMEKWNSNIQPFFIKDYSVAEQVELKKVLRWLSPSKDTVSLLKVIMSTSTPYFESRVCHTKIIKTENIFVLILESVVAENNSTENDASTSSNTDL